ncbi:hypothetical protein [Cohnella silvisoli]|uniref:Aspartyl-phosphate phosphatase Spo0E family protein n=1 Tax=Cohnella silvisoli TaxID=2873699 RepID=A0ABV1KUI4_9BACL|nr:hypothetical protein [Cohnella silvisoli]MCD9023062.1 hypothetical protein [Cohnella silvisoli]
MDKLDLILEQLKELKLITSAVINRIDESDAKIDALSLDLHNIVGRVTVIQESQERHERLLEKLALRSIEQETLV